MSELKINFELSKFLFKLLCTNFKTASSRSAESQEGQMATSKFSNYQSCSAKIFLDVVTDFLEGLACRKMISSGIKVGRLQHRARVRTRRMLPPISQQFGAKNHSILIGI